MSTNPPKDKDRPAGDAGQHEAQETVAADQAKGFIGESPSPFADEDYSQQSGPTSPSAHDHHKPRRG
jgi:hypothetical protein